MASQNSFLISEENSLTFMHVIFNVAGCMTFREKLISICRLLIWPDSLKPITKTPLFKYIENFTPKSVSFQIKKF